MTSEQQKGGTELPVPPKCIEHPPAKQATSNQNFPKPKFDLLKRVHWPDECILSIGAATLRPEHQAIYVERPFTREEIAQIDAYLPGTLERYDIIQKMMSPRVPVHPPEKVADAGTDEAAKKGVPQIDPCPDDERNTWIFHAACQCVRAGLDDDEAQELIEEQLTRSPRPGEIEHALCSARGKRSSNTPRLPRRTASLVERVCAQSSLGGVRELISRSRLPIRLDQPGQIETWVGLLFPGDPLLCVGVTKGAYTAMRKELRGKLCGYSLIVPSPMSAREGLTKKGTLSPRALSNTGARRYIVAEFDKEPSLDRQAAMLWRLASHWPLTCVVFSGNKSLQGWFFCAGESDDPGGKLAKFFGYCTALGADRMMWTRSQFCRMPDGVRCDGKESDLLVPFGAKRGQQRAIFFNPETIKQ